MGHDIEIKDVNGNIEESAYMTGNFSVLDKKYGGIYDMHGHTGKIVAKIAHSIITKLVNDGVVMGQPDPNNSNWGWGVSQDGTKLEEKEFLGVFMYHMLHFYELGLKYPKCVFLSDEVGQVRPYTPYTE